MATNEIQNGCGSSIEAVRASNQKRRRVKSLLQLATVLQDHGLVAVAGLQPVLVSQLQAERFLLLVQRGALWFDFPVSALLASTSRLSRRPSTVEIVCSRIRENMYPVKGSARSSLLARAEPFLGTIS